MMMLIIMYLFILHLFFFCACNCNRYFQPLQLILGATVVILLFLGFVWMAENKAVIRRFRRNHPSLSLAAILGSSYLLLSVLGGVAVFLFGIAFPILSQYSLLPHKSFFVSNTKKCQYLIRSLNIVTCSCAVNTLHK